MEVNMLKKILGLLILGLVLASCGDVVVPTGNTVKNVAPTAEVNQIKVGWTFEGDKATINGFKIFRSVDGGNYSFLIDKIDPNATSHTDTSVEQGKSYKYGVAIIDKEGKAGSTVNQSGAGVSPKQPTGGSGSMDGEWTMDATITGIPVDGDEDEIGRVFYFLLDITETSGELDGSLDFRIPGSDPPAPDPILSFGEEKIEGSKKADGNYEFKMIEVFEDPATTDVIEEKSWTITTTSVTATGFTGTYTNVFGFSGTVVGTKIP
jgi:hypothetical protein